MPGHRIVPVEDADGCRVIAHLQVAVWGMPAQMVVPLEQLLTAAKWGGVLLAAYEGDRAIGFSYGFVGLDEAGSPLLCSHMLGVLPDHQSRGVGEELKLAQRDAARERGLSRIVWTFDPLQSRNAYLNLHKLGAFAERYDVDAYGAMEDPLNRGLPSDRLLADWRIDEPRCTPVGGRHAPLLNPPVDLGQAAWPGGLDRRALDAEMLRIAVPADIDALKRARGSLARDWRLDAREAFQAAFGAGFRAVDVLPPGDARIASYVLRRRRA